MKYLIRFFALIFAAAILFSPSDARSEVSPSDSPNDPAEFSPPMFDEWGRPADQWGRAIMPKILKYGSCKPDPKKYPYYVFSPNLPEAGGVGGTCYEVDCAQVGKNSYRKSLFPVEDEYCYRTFNYNLEKTWWPGLER